MTGFELEKPLQGNLVKDFLAGITYHQFIF